MQFGNLHTLALSNTASFGDGVTMSCFSFVFVLFVFIFLCFFCFFTTIAWDHDMEYAVGFPL